MWSKNNLPKGFNTAAQDFNPGSLSRVRSSTTEPFRSTNGAILTASAKPQENEDVITDFHNIQYDPLTLIIKGERESSFILPP